MLGSSETAPGDVSVIYKQEATSPAYWRTSHAFSKPPSSRKVSSAPSRSRLVTDELGTAEQRRPFEERRAELVASGVAAEDDLFIERVIVDPDPELGRRERARSMGQR